LEREREKQKIGKDKEIGCQRPVVRTMAMERIEPVGYM